MSRVDLSKNRTALLAAYDDVSNPKCKTTWVVYGYEGQSNSLKVVSSGDGDIEEMVDDLNSGKVMYAYLRVMDSNTGLAKYVLVNWQGEGVPENKKGTYASHFNDVQNFFRGAHVTIQARTEEDLDEETVMDKVAKSSGSNYSFHKETARPVDEEDVKPVGSVYRKVRPHVELKTDVRDKFWERTREEERKRRDEDLKRQATERAKLEEERRQREEQEAKAREAREAERIRKINQIKEAERRANAPSKANKESWEETQRQALVDDEERRKRGEEMRRQRAAEAQSLVSARQNNPRSMFEQKPKSIFDQEESRPMPAARAPPPPRKLKHSFMDERQNEERQVRKGPIALPKEEPEFDRPSLPATATPSNPPRQHVPTPRAPVQIPRQAEPTPPVRAPSPKREPSPEPVREPSPVPVREPSPVPERQPSPVPVRVPSPEPTWAPTSKQPTSPSQMSPTSPVSQTPAQLPATRNLLKEGLPPRQDSDNEAEDDDDWGEDDVPARPTAVIAPAAAYETREEPAHAPAAPAVQPSSPLEEEHYPDTAAPAGGGDLGICARALYDYQAADETEVTFDPEDIITNIDMIDEGWWTGIAPNGQHGMFPANYVEVIEYS